MNEQQRKQCAEELHDLFATGRHEHRRGCSAIIDMAAEILSRYTSEQGQKTNRLEPCNCQSHGGYHSRDSEVAALQQRLQRIAEIIRANGVTVNWRSEIYTLATSDSQPQADEKG